MGSLWILLVITIAIDNTGAAQTSSNDQRILLRSKSPYFMQEDLLIEKNQELVIEPGVEIRFAPMIGITVRGIITAKGESTTPIILTSSSASSQPHPNTIRLVDGPSPLEGRLQLLHKASWRSVCTNGHQWTSLDYETACRHLGFQGGSFSSWLHRALPAAPRLLYESPNCNGTETSLLDCQKWKSRQLGSGSCDHHPDLGISCAARHSTASNARHHWRGIKFEDSDSEETLIQGNTFYIKQSRSILRHVVLQYAGTDHDLNATSALHSDGVPPQLENLSILNSAYSGISITSQAAPIVITNCTIRSNHGYGIYLNASRGLASINNCTVLGNSADGIRYVHHQELPVAKLDRADVFDFCTFPATSGQTFPVTVYMEQSAHSQNTKSCSQHVSTVPGQVLTIEFLQMQTDLDGTSTIEVYDGTSSASDLLARVTVRNNSLPQSVTSRRQNMHIKLNAAPRTQMVAFFRISSGNRKLHDLSVTSSKIGDNNGRGIAVENIRSSLYVDDTSVMNNSHVAGIHVLGGCADVDVVSSEVSGNSGAGINITVTGGYRNISRSRITSNQGYGLAVWLNDTSADYLHFRQVTVLEYSEVEDNEGIGALIGNSTGISHVNITGNSFNRSISTAVQVESNWLQDGSHLLKLHISHNLFIKNLKLGIRMTPALNVEGTIEYNQFMEHSLGAILIKNPRSEELNVLPADLLIQHNEFYNNRGHFVVNIGLSPYSEVQTLIFTRNFLKDNQVSSPFAGSRQISRLLPRSRVSAVVAVSSSNVHVFRNILHNLHSLYEIGSHLEDQSKTINCTFNWLGHHEERKVSSRLFHRKDRYNLAKIEYFPYLLHSSNPAANTIVDRPHFIAKFWVDGDKVGGEIEGLEVLLPGEYTVERDINVRYGGKLILHAGVILRFPPAVGMLVAGRLETKGTPSNRIVMTLDEEIPTVSKEIQVIGPEEPPVRLYGGRTYREGRLLVRVGQRWGTVCNYGWNMLNAALVCHQLGFTLDPDDWNLVLDLPNAGITEDIILSNVQCTKEDTDLTSCKAEGFKEFENVCNHADDVGIKCSELAWAGVRLAPLAEASNLRFITIEKAGLLDYVTNTLQPALRIDFARHSLEGVKVMNSLQDGLGVIYSDISSINMNTVKNSEFSKNRGSGISFKQLGLRISDSSIETNGFAGIRHNPVLSAFQQREFAGWFMLPITQTIDRPYEPIIIPGHLQSIKLTTGVTKYVVTSKVRAEEPLKHVLEIQTHPDHVLCLQLLNPIEGRSTEQILIYDGVKINPRTKIWMVKRDVSVFPVSSSSFSIILEYHSGMSAIGGVVLAVTALRVRSMGSKLDSSPEPNLTLRNTKISSNRRGISASYYNLPVDESGNHFFRKSKEFISLLNCEVSHNQEEAIHVHSHRIFGMSNISNIEFHVNSTSITGNGRGIVQSGDMQQSNNLFHWFVQGSSMERNQDGGFQVVLPHVWQYSENSAHSVVLGNNTWANNTNFEILVDGHYTSFDVSYNKLLGNRCKRGLMSIRGMEKRIEIHNNMIKQNSGRFMVLIRIDSQSDISGEVPARFHLNDVQDNSNQGLSRINDKPSFVVGFEGIQKVRINRNLFGSNLMDYELVAGVRTASIDTTVDVTENWWGVADPEVIERRIFDFDDWNNHAIANFSPFLLDGSFHSSISDPRSEVKVDLDDIGGTIHGNLSLHPRPTPYRISSDLTIMPNAILNIYPDVVMEFAPSVGILVLGTLNAAGEAGHEIVMRPMARTASPPSHAVKRATGRLKIRLSKGTAPAAKSDDGFLEFFNDTLLQWTPIRDRQFTERNAQVVCRQLGYDALNVHVAHGRHPEVQPAALRWNHPVQCSGSEDNLEDCSARANGPSGHNSSCLPGRDYVFIRCGASTLLPPTHWGGIRLANGHFEHHDEQKGHPAESVLTFVNIHGAGVLHNEKSPAIQSVVKSPVISNVRIINSASHGINLISPQTVNLQSNTIDNAYGTGIDILSLTGGQDADESFFSPLKDLNLPYNVFGLLDICDTSKEITIEERLLIYYKYDNNPVDCVKTFRSGYRPFGFRLLQFNLLSSTDHPDQHDQITLYDGGIHEANTRTIGQVDSTSRNQKQLFKTEGPSLSIKLHANGGSAVHGFIAEVVTLPILSIGFNRDIQYSIVDSIVSNCQGGAVRYATAGEVNAALTLENNQFVNNCLELYGDLSTCQSAVVLDVQNTQAVSFRNNLVQGNQGGLAIHADSTSSATSLKGWIHNNLFADNSNRAALLVEGRQGSPYQEVTIFRNYFVNNHSPFSSNIILQQVVSNMTFNYLHANRGLHLLEIYGFQKVRLPIYQSTSHNGFYDNHAMGQDGRSTIVAGSPGQHYVDNILSNPDNDYEVSTISDSLQLDLPTTQIDARYNWWGYNESRAVAGRIRDHMDSPELLKVDYTPYHRSNQSILSGKCPPAWDLVGDTCYIYIGAPMDFVSARNFCRRVNASMPFITVDHHQLRTFLTHQQNDLKYSDRIWLQQFQTINECTCFRHKTIEIDDCSRLSPFICEIDPRVQVNPLSWRQDIAVCALGATGLALLLLATAIGCWISKSKRRKLERLQRRTSIRQSLHSLRSLGSSMGLTEVAYRRSSFRGPSKSTDTLASLLDYKMMMGQSLESLAKSDVSSSTATDQSQLPAVTQGGWTGLPSHSTFRPRHDSAGSSVQDDVTPNSLTKQIEGSSSSGSCNASTLALDSSSGRADSMVQFGQGLEPAGYFPEMPLASEAGPKDCSQGQPGVFEYDTGPRSRLLEARLNSLQTSVDTPLKTLLETNLDTHPDIKLEKNTPVRSKSECLLETNLDLMPNGPTEFQQLSVYARSKSQPLETAI